MMPTRVVNISKGFVYDVYIGRAGQGQDGYFGNPFKLGEIGREGVLRLYRDWFYRMLEKDLEFKCRVHKLKGKVLGCFCKPLQCHGDVIVEYLNNLQMPTNEDL